LAYGLLISDDCHQKNEPMFLENLKSKISKYLPVPKTQNAWVMMASLFIMVTGNISLCQNLLKTYPLSLNNLPFLASLFVFFLVTLTIIIQILCIGKSAKWVLAVLLIVSSLKRVCRQQPSLRSWCHFNDR
jgi:lipid A ethanolaminephosphotransferase